MAKQKILEFYRSGQVVGNLFIEIEILDNLACDFSGVIKFDAVRVMSQDSAGLTGPELIMLPGAKAQFHQLSNALTINEASLRCYLLGDNQRVVSGEFKLDRTGTEEFRWFSLSGGENPYLFRWRKPGQNYLHDNGPGLPLVSPGGEEVALLATVKDDVFQDTTAVRASRVMLRRQFGTTAEAFEKLLRQPLWTGGHTFAFGDEWSRSLTGYQWNAPRDWAQKPKEEKSQIAINLTRRGAVACWNATVAELMTTSQHSIRDGGFVSLVPYLPPPTFDPAPWVQLRFTGSQSGSGFDLAFSELRRPNGKTPGAQDFVVGQGMDVECPCFVAHNGQPLRIRADVRFSKAPPLAKPVRGEVNPLWVLDLTNLSVTFQQTVRVGPMDLVIEGVTNEAKLKVVITRRWAFTADAAVTWRFDDKGKLKPEGSSNVYVMIPDTSRLPLLRVEAGGQDPLVSDGFVLENPYEGRAEPLVISLVDQSANQNCWLTYKETSSRTKHHEAEIKVFIQDLSNHSRVGPVADCLVLDPEPLQILKVVARPPKVPSKDDPNLFALWSNGVKEGPSWQVRNPFFTYLTPPQALGEATEKFPANPSANPGSAGVAAEKGEDIPPGGIADMRFGPNGTIDFVSTYREQNYGEPGINTRRLLGNVGERDPGVKVEGVQVELLYGLQGTIDYPYLRLAEIATRLGEIPAQEPDNIGDREPTVVEESAFKAMVEDWKKAFAMYLSRLAILEPRDERDLRDEIKQRDGILLTENVSFQPREVETDIIVVPGNPIPHVTANLKAGLPPTPRLRYPVSPARQQQTPSVAMPSNLAYHRSDGLPGGFQWGFESVAIYEQLWRNRKSTAAEIAGLAFSALGGYGRLKAKFGQLTKIEAHVGMGRTHYYTVERIGRIGVYWNKAKHVIVYERSVVPSRQFFGYQDDQFGRPVLRKVKEYVEILQPDKKLPDKDSAPEDAGPVRGILFHDHVILVHGSWGADVYPPGRLVPIGWQIPLWRAEGVDTTIYPKPQISLRMPTDGTQPTDSYLALMENPQDLWFYTDTRDGLSEDVMTWPTVLNVDYADVAIPPAFLPGQGYASDPEALEGDLPDPPSIPPGLERFTHRLERTEQKANLVADRTDAGQVSAIMRNVTMMRARAAAVDPDPNKVPATQKTLASAAALVTALDQQWEKAAREIAQTPKITVAEVQAKVSAVLKKAKDQAGTLQNHITSTGLNMAVPPGSWCTQPLVYWGVEEPLRRQIREQKAATWTLLQSTVFQPWRQELQTFVDVLLNSGLTLADAQTRIIKAIEFHLLRFHDSWEKITIAADGLLRSPNELLDGAMVTAMTRLAEWFEGMASTVQSLGGDAATSVADLRLWLSNLKAAIKRAVRDANGIFTREIGTAVVTFLSSVDYQPGTSVWQWWNGRIDNLLNQLDTEIAVWQAELVTPADVIVVAGHINQGIRSFADALLDENGGLLPELHAQLKKHLGAVSADLQTQVAAADKLVDRLVTHAQNLLVGPFQTATSIQQISDRVVGVLSDWTRKIEADFQATAFDPIWVAVEAAAKSLVQKLCTIAWQLFPFDIADAAKRITEILGQAQAYADRLEDLAGPWVRDAQALADRVRALGRDMDREVHRLTGQVQEGIAKAAAATGSVGALAQAGSDKIRAFRAFCESPDIFPVKMNRRHIALVISEGKKALDMTPVVARYQEAADKLGALGLRLPSRQLLDRIVPASLGDFDVSRIFSDLGGVRFDSFLPGLKMPAIADDRIKVSHGFDRESLRAWVRAEADVDMPSPATLFSIGPVAVTLRGANFSATCFAQAQADGTMSKQASGAVRGAWEVSIGGTPIVTFADTALRFENGALHFDLQPAKIQLNALLKMISDLLPDMGGDGEEDGPGISVGLTTVNYQGIKLPSGVRVKLDLPLPDISGGAFGITGLQLGAFFRLRAIDEQLMFAFRLGTGFNLGRKESPFAITIFVLGGGGWIEVEAEYEPARGGLSTSVSIGITANAILAINLGVVSGVVGIYLGVFAEFHQQSKAPGTLAIGVMLMFRGEVDVLGIINIYLMLLLEAIYESGGNGSRLFGRGTVELRIKICWCFTLKVRKSVTYTLAQSGGGGNSRSKSLAASTSAGKPKNFDTCTTAANRQASLLV